MCEMGNRRGKRVECGNKFALKYTVKIGWIQNKSLMRYFEINTREDYHKIGILNGKKIVYDIYVIVHKKRETGRTLVILTSGR